MKKEKKTISDRPWFAPLIVTISIIMFMVLAAFQLGPSSNCISIAGNVYSGKPKSIGNTLTFEAFLGVPVIVIVWIIFAIHSAVKESAPERKKYRSINTKEVSTYGEYIPKTRKKMSFDKFSVIFSVIINVTSVLLVIFYLLGSVVMKIEQVGVMSDGGLVASVSMIFYFITMPVRIVSIILSIISISNNKNKFKSIDKMPKETRNLMNRNKVSMIILIILTVVPFLYIFLPILGFRLKFAGV